MKKQYRDLNDAACYESTLGFGDTEVWYQKPETFQQQSKDFNFEALRETHVFLGRVKDRDVDALFRLMQGEIWSPNGEAREMIYEKHLSHTSMSIGDIIKTPDGIIHVVEMIGFAKLRPYEKFYCDK